MTHQTQGFRWNGIRRMQYCCYEAIIWDPASSTDVHVQVTVLVCFQNRVGGSTTFL